MRYRMQGINIEVKQPKPYKPSYLTELLGNNMEVKKNSVVADIGTGCGILALLASKMGAKKVYAIDIDKDCEKSIRENSKANKVNNIIFLNGGMLKPLKEKADAIIANLPQTPSNKKIDVHRHGSKDGAKYNEELIKKGPKHLKKNGIIFFSLMSISNPIKILKLVKKNFHVTIVSAKEREFEKKRFDRLSRGLSKYILNLVKRDKSILYYRNGKWYYVVYIIKAVLK